MQVMASRVDMKYNRLQLDMEITEGDYAGYYTRLQNRAGFWGMTINLYLDRKSAWKFARTVDAFRASNADFMYDDDNENDEQVFTGMYVGVVTRYKQYLGNDGLVKKKLVPYITIPVQDVKTGNFEVPDMIPLDNKPTAAPSGVVDMSAPQGFVESDEETPF